ncbi:hypothetical protein ABMY35_20595 [Pseudoalteromonas sp. BZB3]|uniref:hypothetical protein n=1 Tax=Pseudoalteromonas sp. BZB3 TaxID=3136670 RepID=UPI0032C4B28C
MTATKKFSFDRGFIAGTLWGASAVFFIFSGYLLSEFNGDNFSAFSFLITLIMGIALSVGSFKTFKNLS